MSDNEQGHEDRNELNDREARLRRLLNDAVADEVGDPLTAVSAVYAARRLARRQQARRFGTVLAATVTAAAVVAAVVLVPSSAKARPSHVAAGGRGGATEAPPAGGPGPKVELTSALVPFSGCDAYLGFVRSQALGAVGPFGLPGDGGYGVSYTPFRTGPYDAPGQAGTGTAASSGATAAAAAPSAPGSFSSTDDQVAGVDEPDTVKTDGRDVLTLSQSVLRVLDTTGRVIGTLPLSGDTGGGMLLAGSTALVFSTATTGGAGVATPEYGAHLAAGSGGQVAVVDLSTPTHPALLRTFSFDSQLVSARLVNGTVRLALLEADPAIPFVEGDGNDASATAINRQLIEDSTLSEWLPSWQVASPDGSVSAKRPIAACTSVLRPPQASGWSTLSVLSLNPSSAVLGGGTSIVGNADTVYATPDHFWIAGPAGGSYSGGQQTGCCSIDPPRSAATDVYMFDFPSSGPPVFEASGSVPGWLIDSYALDEDGSGLLRVASTSQAADGRSESQISVIAVSGRSLVTVGSVGGIGAGEFIRAVRFIGTLAYLVTYQSFDPLYVVDLSNPAKPILAASLDQPGFSEFLYPLPGGRLLGIGVNIVDREPSGLVVATYDVSDPHHPTRLSSSNVTPNWWDGEGYDPHAFLWYAPASLALVANPNEGSMATLGAYRLGPDGSLAVVATLGQPNQSVTRSVVVAGQVWAVTDEGVVTAPLTQLNSSTWHAY